MCTDERCSACDECKPDGCVGLAPDGARSCDGIGEPVLTYDDCARVLAAVAEVCEIDVSKKELENVGWDGPAGCHVQGDHSCAGNSCGFQFNSNLGGGGSGGHRPVCIIKHSGPDTAQCGAPEFGVCTGIPVLSATVPSAAAAFVVTVVIAWR